jgi:Cd2+/Zn2+-exporting ATPase
VRDGKKKLSDDSSGSRGEIPQATDLKSITGRGIQAMVDGDLVHVGKDDLFAEVEGSPLPDAIRAIVESLEQNGRTTMIVRRAERYLGVIGLMDTPREASKRTISRLRDLGIKRMIMISGDNQKVADAVAKEVGLDEARGDLMPDDKVAEIKKLEGEGGVAMVGDGVNDAPAMATASVGIAMGAAGSDVALETADVALMADNLDNLPLAIGLSRATRRIIRQNLWMSLGMVAFLVPATIFGLNIGPAVALHEGSTLVVVFNALRLLAYRD